MEFVGIIVAVSNLEEKAGGNATTPQCYRDVVVQTQEEIELCLYALVALMEDREGHSFLNCKFVTHKMSFS